MQILFFFSNVYIYCFIALYSFNIYYTFVDTSFHSHVVCTVNIGAVYIIATGRYKYSMSAWATAYT